MLPHGLPNINIDLDYQGQKWNGTLYSIMTVDASNIQAVNIELASQASLASWFGVVCADSVSKFEEHEEKHDRMAEVLGNAYRSDLSNKGEKFTESKIAGYVAQHPDIVKSSEELSELRVVKNKLKSIVNALEHRREMLVQLSANLRKEAGIYQEGSS